MKMMHPVKRRRLGQSPKFINKPFRSPLRRPDVRCPVQAPEEQSHRPDSVPERNPALSPSVTTLEVPVQSSPTSALSLDYQSAHPEYKNLQKKYSALSHRLTQLRQSLNTSQQALQIEASGQDAELQTLITKWRTIAREAAEELYADAKERINRMGGLIAWRRQAAEEALHLNRNTETDEMHHDNVSVLEHQQLDDLEDSEKEESSFSMATMLQQMNIDLSTIGFDGRLERWVE
ncbi:uncharacterized protein Z518_02367 [Rhinocladiella mackenziei CBS 650.93]|uniref:Rhinocladiella mackenziei CBS 650.93 unplaced genomic scaffold supercont1.2, whole genome shotgun sequence n=1 Tax=Rhinocladiella mackenziei CBS 650.93 TaxID=1442369 RepID=A0A0D2HB98_9EURO|nr:uncharacterized protein Z518_02367 [Rhinocladiella mackenziei CBS 650.93]KIX07713.1 hypothetical protein Z518_02367 [Rhinocladiella mackenziei CBS 650.93]